MTITELRIGNLVYTDRMIDNELVVVNTISYNPDKKDYLLSISHFPYLTISQCKPIPLTEEWLLKFGFYTNGINDIYYTLEIEEDSCDLYYLKEDKTIAIGQPYEAGGTELKFEYVHQLQNLYFALTGEELVCK